MHKTLKQLQKVKESFPSCIFCRIDRFVGLDFGSRSTWLDLDLSEVCIVYWPCLLILSLERFLTATPNIVANEDFNLSFKVMVAIFLGDELSLF